MVAPRVEGFKKLHDIPEHLKVLAMAGYEGKIYICTDDGAYVSDLKKLTKLEPILHEGKESNIIHS